MSNAQSMGLSRPASRGWQIGLWTAQIVLAALLAMAGTMKTFVDPHALPAMGINCPLTAHPDSVEATR
jgi:hypothetical protein